jgi:AcrR family transcriptional regulator
VTQTRQRLTAVARRQAVLETACRVFSRSSYRGATTADIAREAGISEPILYRHFGSKRDLYLACLDHAWRTFREEAQAAIDNDPDGCLGVIADRYMAKGKRLRVVDLWIQALTVAPEDKVIAAALRDQVREVHDFFAELIRDGQARGIVVADRDPVAEAWIFVGGGLLATMDSRLGGLLGDDLERVRRERGRWMRGTDRA